MSRSGGWAQIEAEAADAFAGAGKFPLRAYSEFMPAPWVGIKPYHPRQSRASVTSRIREDGALDITEYEQSQELEPGLDRIASTLLFELAKLARGTTRVMSKTLLAGNLAWPAQLLEAAATHGFRHETFSIAMPLALSRSQDDKGNVRWTLYGASHHGPARAFWSSFAEGEAGRFHRLVDWMTSRPDAPGSIKVIADPGEAPGFAELLGEGGSLEGVRTVVTFKPFGSLPEAVRRAYLERRIDLVPSPGSLLFAHHPRYAELARSLPRATQIPLLHLFPRVEGGYALRIPQSGWLDEHHGSGPLGHEAFAGGHRIVSSIRRSHRWQRLERDEDHASSLEPFDDRVTTALFSTEPDDMGLYGKPMARNSQVWTESYQVLLDGPAADPAELERASRAVRAGGRFGYRLLYPPMRAGVRELFWHLPLVGRLKPEARSASRYGDGSPLGYVSAEIDQGRGEPVALQPRLLARPGHVEAAKLFPREPGHQRHTTAHNIRKVLDLAEMLGGPAPRSLCRQSIHIPRHASFDDWLAYLHEIAAHPRAVQALVGELRALAEGADAAGADHTFAQTANRRFEESLWRTIAELSEGQFIAQENADAIALNRGRTGGPAAAHAGVAVSEGSDLHRLGEHLHARYRELIRGSQMEGRAEVVDHLFKWETDFDFGWSGGWARNQSGRSLERNIVLRIPGRSRAEAVIMADHYDTAYMEDVYQADRGGDGLRASAHGADDNHSGTAALLQAAEVLLPMAREGRLERDVWLVHLTGEEFPADCLGARALARSLVERSLAFTREDGSRIDASGVRVAGAFILDMVAHNSARDRDLFLICPGEGVPSARLALRAHAANQRWNRRAAELNQAPERAGKGRAIRMPDGATAPPAFLHLPVVGHVAAKWEPRSVLFNTDGQIFSDVGVPVVLFMENYDINRSGYHDTRDTLANIDLDYAAALIAIAIEAVVDCAVTGEI